MVGRNCLTTAGYVLTDGNIDWDLRYEFLDWSVYRKIWIWSLGTLRVDSNFHSIFKGHHLHCSLNPIDSVSSKRSPWKNMRKVFAQISLSLGSLILSLTSKYYVFLVFLLLWNVCRTGRDPRPLGRFQPIPGNFHTWESNQWTIDRSIHRSAVHLLAARFGVTHSTVVQEEGELWPTLCSAIPCARFRSFSERCTAARFSTHDF